MAVSTHAPLDLQAIAHAMRSQPVPMHYAIDWEVARRVCTPAEVGLLQDLGVEQVMDPSTYYRAYGRWPCIGSVFSWREAGGSGELHHAAHGAFWVLNGTLMCMDAWDRACTRTIEAAGLAYAREVFGEPLASAPTAHPIHRVVFNFDKPRD
jgi:hypothetical protein